VSDNNILAQLNTANELVEQIADLLAQIHPGVNNKAVPRQILNHVNKWWRRRNHCRG
jgi:hypothetical protein